MGAHALSLRLVLRGQSAAIERRVGDVSAERVFFLKNEKMPGAPDGPGLRIRQHLLVAC